MAGGCKISNEIIKPEASGVDEEQQNKNAVDHSLKKKHREVYIAGIFVVISAIIGSLLLVLLPTYADRKNTNEISYVNNFDSLVRTSEQKSSKEELQEINSVFVPERKEKYILITGAKDSDTGEYIEDVLITLWSFDGKYHETHSSNDYPYNDPLVYFYKVPSNSLLYCKYEAKGYIADIDNFYFDALLQMLIDEDGKKHYLEMDDYKTEAKNHSSNGIKIIDCSVYNNNQSINFNYRPDWNLVGLVNSLVREK